jgi:wyosine [tRNA(Phe)-imidazoG37] synthetase (radical SAM superfamily)
MNTDKSSTLAFGPVPSRRLGRSLGINNIPPKFCSYSCLYCQVGRTLHKEVERREFYQPEEIAQAVKTKLSSARSAGETIDYLTFVPDGEPTLDSRLSDTIDLLRPFNIRIAIISNASLIWREDVRQALNKADLVSLKVDTTDNDIWVRINRPHDSLKLTKIQQGITEFANEYRGELITETMLLSGINDSKASVNGVADFLATIQPVVAYVAIPTRPTAELNISVPDEEQVLQAYAVFHAKLAHVEYLIGYEGNEFAFTGDLEQDLLSITAVHPMREEAVSEILEKAGKGWDFIQMLMDRHRIKKVAFAGNNFYVRVFKE